MLIYRTKFFDVDGVPDAREGRAQIPRVQVKYSIGIVHEYSSDVTLALDYPSVPEDPDVNTWPSLPPYTVSPKSYITECFRRDICALDATAFNGDMGRPVMENVREWEPTNV